MNKYFSNFELENILGIPVITYSDLNSEVFDKYKLEDLLPFVILFQTGIDYGHWTLLFENNKGNIEFFDSLGNIPDFEKQMNVNEVSSNKYYPRLTELLLKSGKGIDYNDYVLQKTKEGINTCGRWVIHRYLNRDIPIEEYVDFFKKKKKKGKDLDRLITDYTSKI